MEPNLRVEQIKHGDEVDWGLLGNLLASILDGIASLLAKLLGVLCQIHIWGVLGNLLANLLRRGLAKLLVCNNTGQVSTSALLKCVTVAY